MIVVRHRRALLIAFTLIAIFGAIILSIATRVTPHVRDTAVGAINQRMRSDVDLESLQISVFPRPTINGTGLTLRHNGRTDVKPLIQIGTYSASAGLWGILRSPLHLKTVELERLDISIPPGGVHSSDGPPPAPSAASPSPEPAPAPASPAQSHSNGPRLIIDRIVSKTARLEIVPRDPRKLPREFAIHDLVMNGLGEGKGAPFEASLTNPVPRGEITTRGLFGPWQADSPGQTPVQGDYTFKDANLDTIKGIAGILSSVGSYTGVLERIDVKGETDTPDFSIDLAGQPVPLKTRFHAIVDGTNGDTWLERVDAKIIETPIVAKGAVVRAQDVKGRRVSLDVTIDDGRIEDILKLGVKASKPLMTGRMKLDTKMLLPAGQENVIDKLELAGKFLLDQARFTSFDIQSKINELSKRGKGKPADAPGPTVASRLSGTFKLHAGTLTFSDLSFGVPGAIVQLAGTYDIKGATLDFKGNLLLDAGLADMTSGWKSYIGRIAQPLFRRPGGGTRLPIRISGPRDKPEFGLDIRRALGPG